MGLEIMNLSYLAKFNLKHRNFTLMKKSRQNLNSRKPISKKTKSNFLKTKFEPQHNNDQKLKNKPTTSWLSKIKILYGVIAALVAILTTILTTIYNALPHFSIIKETVNAEDPVSSEFRFTNTGWITAEKVKIICAPNLALGGSSGKELLGMKNIQIQTFTPDNLSISKDKSVVKNCGLFVKNIPIYPKDSGIEITVEYQLPIIKDIMKEYVIKESAYFSFRYDSSVRGYTLVPDIKQ
jgi:hypothetical protein